MKLINNIEEYEWLWGGKMSTARKEIRMGPLEATILHFFCKKAKTRIVEIGRMFGGSTFVICNCSTVPVISIDHVYRENLKKIEEQFEGRLQLINEKSHRVKLQDTYDVLYVDGDHSGNGVRGDIVNYWDNLKINGHAIFHDFWTRPSVRRNVQTLLQNNIGEEITITDKPTTQLSIEDGEHLKQDIIVLQKIQELPGGFFQKK
tara:strand:- start:46 stop:657 length:612 start_codon:yes stop_codon:yes gene_type:complete